MAQINMLGVSKRFGDLEVVSDTTLEIKDGEFAVFVGPSGCGKSTLLRLLAGLDELTSGEINLNNQRIDHLAPAKRGLAMVFQSYALYPHMTVYQNMSYALKVAKEQKTVIDKKVKKVAKILQLSEYLDRKPKELSGGQRQRVAIGRAIVREPKVFLFDEPLSNLDAKLRVQMRIELTKLHKKLKTTMIYVTHDQVEAMTMADKIVVINNGKVEQVGAPLEIYRRPANQFVAGFIGSPAMNFFSGVIKDVTTTGVHFDINNSGTSIFVKCPGADVSIGEKIQFGVRPEHFIFKKKRQQLITGEVYAVERLGGETYIYMSSETEDDVIVHCNGDREVKIGEEIDVGFSIEDCHLFNSKGWAIR